MFAGATPLCRNLGSGVGADEIELAEVIITTFSQTGNILNEAYACPIGSGVTALQTLSSDGGEILDMFFECSPIMLVDGAP